MYSIVPSRRRRSGYSISPYSFPFGGFGGFPGFTGTSPLAMRTDISETEDSFELSVELPGFSKEDVSAELQDGYLVISASTHHETEECSEDQCTCTSETEEKTECTCEQETTGEHTEEQPTGEQQPTWRRRERYFGSCRRMYYVGEDIDEEGISAKFENGLLSVSVPKQTEKQEQKKPISIS